MILCSIDPARGETVWESEAPDATRCATAVTDARAAFTEWAQSPLKVRIAVAHSSAKLLGAKREVFAEPISRATGNYASDNSACPMASFEAALIVDQIANIRGLA